MLANTCSLFSKLCIRSSQRTLSIAVLKETQDTNISPIFTKNSNPVEHDESCLNQIYRISPDIEKVIEGNLSSDLKKQAKIFQEIGILIRQPAVEVISYLEQADYTKAINKYVLYGKEGVGKTTTLVHLIHYGLVKRFIVLHLPWVCTWFRYPKEVSQSPLEKDKLDLPIDGEMWLKYFKTLNKLTLDQYDLKTSKEYIWSQREIIKSGDSLSNLIEFGIDRKKFSCGVINALVEELKTASIAGKCRTLVVIDGFNAFLSNCTRVCNENEKDVPPDKISITSAFYNCVNYNWCNGAAILTVDKRATKDRRDSDDPIYLLGKKGFELLDPFVPICVEKYSRDEFKVILQYYTNRNWIRDISPGAEKEIELLTNKNPVEIWRFCRSI
ncbi:PREDICTED: 28S ribosomal protein S29, mitochondrial [Eufriesea mexicana]|uniref:28S ribosomal protein S29, mitochondrial n=1 Tax=Eufriesea mexicana TaxID=516756 RepID=UPI00083C452E|nr:PREDICTED: 28S ribosomal protein S29, mitochondrial [Eufriesea mexicana]